MDQKFVLGVDIGGSHITATLIDLKIGKQIDNSEVREPLNAKGSADEIILLWADVINKAFGNHQVSVKRIGIAMPGPFDYNNGIAWMKNQNKYDSLYGLNVKNLLAKELNIPSHNIRFVNDAESFLKGEVFSGVAKGASKAIGLTLGTGLGSARYNNGIVEDADLWKTPFLDGIAEDYLSTRWFVARYLSLSGVAVSGVKELTELINEDKRVLQAFKEFGYNLSLFLKEIIKKDKPEIIVLGGNISNAFHLFSGELNEQLKAIIEGSIIKKAALGEAASLIGAATCWQETDKHVYENTNV